LKYWELIAADLASKGWTWGYVSEIDAGGGTLFRVDAHRGDGKRYIVRSDQLLTAFLELQEQDPRSFMKWQDPQEKFTFLISALIVFIAIVKFFS
jgi:hypothetical protein